MKFADLAVVGHMHNQDPNYPIPSENSHMGQHKVGVVSAGYRRIGKLLTQKAWVPDQGFHDPFKSLSNKTRNGAVKKVKMPKNI